MHLYLISLAAIALGGNTLASPQSGTAPQPTRGDCDILADAWKAMGGKNTTNAYCPGRSVGNGIIFGTGYVAIDM